MHVPPVTKLPRKIPIWRDSMSRKDRHDLPGEEADVIDGQASREEHLLDATPLETTLPLDALIWRADDRYSLDNVATRLGWRVEEVAPPASGGRVDSARAVSEATWRSIKPSRSASDRAMRRLRVTATSADEYDRPAASFAARYRATRWACNSNEPTWSSRSP